jgi:hypothetical protein
MKHLYHVTLAANLEGIADHGLRAGGGSSFGGGYEGHARGRVFLSERGAVRCWWGKIEDLVEHHNEGRDIIPNLQVPVVLRVSLSDVAPLAVASVDRPGGGWGRKKLVEDPLGSRDCLGGRSFYVESAVIRPGGIEVWDGRRWHSVRTIDPEDAMRAYVKSVKVVEGDDGYGGEGEEGWTEVTLQLPGSWPP